MALSRRLAAGLAVGAALALAGCVPAPDPAPAPPGAPAPGYVQSVRASEVDLWRGINDRGLTLDVRGPEEWNDALGHLDGATHIPFAELEARVGEIAGYRERPVLVYDRDGNRAQAAAQYLSRAGYRDVSWVDGGLQAYRAWMQSR
jgi:rhodanese-related sulfurtransferase